MSLDTDETTEDVYKRQKYSLTYPEYWNSTEKDMIFIIWGRIIALRIVLNVIEAVSYTHLDLYKRQA